MIHRSKLPYFFLALSAVLAVAAVVVMVVRSGVIERFRRANAPAPAVSTPATPGPANPDPANPGPVTDPEIPALQQPLDPDSPETNLRDLGLEPGVTETDPETLVNNIAKALEAGDFNALSRLLDNNVCDEKTLAQLKSLADQHPLKVHQPDGIREIGELELNTRTRWSLTLDDAEPGRDRIYLDLLNRDGKWGVEKLILPPPPGEPVPRAVLADPLGIADSFLQAVLKQDFEFACDFIDPRTVSDVKIATLCIIFEEGKYQLRNNKPLRAMFNRGDTVGYLANVNTVGSPDGTDVAQFAMTLRQPPAPSNWIISEINLDTLLADYAERVAGGDIYYSPLVKNPLGGETLALYFEFDEDQINPRTRRQLEIVAQVLRADPGKKITLSGHTDALGTVQYNNQLSGRRAATVADFLTSVGVSATQIVTIAKGASQPRRPNVTESGEDDPMGRRANRRTEIYLDF
ncbi:MAG: OmpA family protein [Akkermansiaceae bacterium]|nr:OmpA family protein [Akkermansiaceae bacterium]